MNYGDFALQIGVLLFALSFHEMAHAWVNITYMSDEDYKIEVEKRKLME